MSVKPAKPGDLVVVTLYARVKEPFVGGGGYWINFHGVDLSVLDHQVEQVIPMDILSEKAQVLLKIFEEAKGSYWPIWTLTKKLQQQGILDPKAPLLDSQQPQTDWDLAMEELVEADLIEELPDLHCRYRLKYPRSKEKSE